MIYLLGKLGMKIYFCSSVLLELLCNGNPQPEMKWILRTPKGDRELFGDGYVHKMKKQVGKYVCTMIIKVGPAGIGTNLWIK